MKRYSDFNSVEELYEYYNISPKNMITEKKEVDIPGEKGNKDEDIISTNKTTQYRMLTK